MDRKQTQTEVKENEKNSWQIQSEW
jgi:hypothetical protein